jgi:hypothetical protein
MALSLAHSHDEGCSTFSFIDQTGAYPSPSTGYGAQNGVTSPSDFDTYVLSIWGPDQDPSTDTAQFIYDLLEEVPTADDDNYYTWTFTEDDLGFELDAGVYYMQAVGTKDGEEYTSQTYPVLVNELCDLVDAKMKDYDPTCPCKAGCQDPALIWANYKLLKEGATCSADQSRNIITWLQNQLERCC